MNDFIQYKPIHKGSIYNFLVCQTCGSVVYDMTMGIHTDSHRTPSDLPPVNPTPVGPMTDPAFWQKVSDSIRPELPDRELAVEELDRIYGEAYSACDTYGLGPRKAGMGAIYDRVVAYLKDGR